MQITFQREIIEKLSSKGILAYVAVSLADGTEATTAALAGLVRCQTAVMLEGLKEVSVAVPELVAKAPKNKWRCGVVMAGDGVTAVQNLDSERFRLFVDDLKKYHDYLNPVVAALPAPPFSMGGSDGRAIQQFLREHREWTQEDWLIALRNRAKSIVLHGHASRTEPFVTWVRKLPNYSAGMMNQFNRPVEGNGKHGEADRVRKGNREAVANAISHA